VRGHDAHGHEIETIEMRMDMNDSDTIQIHNMILIHMRLISCKLDTLDTPDALECAGPRHEKHGKCTR